MTQHSECKIFIIDDDESVRTGISLLLSSGGYVVESFENVRDFLDADKENGPGCILLDIFLDGDSGLDLYSAIKEKFSNLISPNLYSYVK